MPRRAPATTDSRATTGSRATEPGYGPESGSGPDPGSPAPGQSPGFLLWHATLRWQREVTAALSPLGLTHVQFVLLASLWWLVSHDERPNQLALARHAGADVAMTSQVVRALQAKGLLVREVDAADTRAMRLGVTAVGAELALRAMRTVEAVDARFFAPVPTEHALDLLRRLTATD